MTYLVLWHVWVLLLVHVRTVLLVPVLEVFGDTGCFLSPHYPINYPNYQNLVYKAHLSSPGPQWVRLSVSLDLERGDNVCYDYVRINNGRRLCGTGEACFHIFLEGSEFSLLFRSDNSIGWTGFNVSYTAIKDETGDEEKEQGDSWEGQNGTNSTVHFVEYGSFLELPFYVRWEFVLWGVVIPVIVVTGLVGNAMTLVVLRRLKSNMACFRVYFVALAVSDLAVVITGIISEWVSFQVGLQIEAAHFLLCKVKVWVAYSCGMLSSWLLVATTAQRALAVLRPLSVRLTCSGPRAKVVVTSLALVVFGVHANMLDGYDVLQEAGQYGNSSTCGIARHADFYAAWTVVDLFASSLVPFGLLAASNAVLVWTLARSLRHARRQLLAAPVLREQPRGSTRPNNASSLSFTLVLLSLVYFLLTAPLCAQMIVERYLAPPTGVTSQATRIVVFDVFRCLWRASFAVNFYLYLLTGTRFRSELRKMFGTCWRKSARPKSALTQSSGTDVSTSQSGLACHP